ncbi:hypothetical protein GETHPA_20480 [Geothrix rubra]|uniref:DUF3501 family protein n=1 Tax=Geothrix rubra TaxID=2927977 RepID=A0ABQ5Q7Z6_9BACT|nr:DUF3501 family protein [Geothrix rubra]GLH70515.1 hypothetical protein GETHPA_20480 [Geothrix rubra]
MRPVAREEILDFVTYGERREALRASAMKAKDLRRVHVGEHLTFLFENPETVRYQVQEMVRAEQLVREADIRHELETYNALLGEAGDLGCTLLIEIDDPAERTRLLRAWRGLPGQVLLLLADGRAVPARWDEAQMDEDRLSSVQFLRFPVGGGEPVGIQITFPGLAAEVPFSRETARALKEDLAG